MSTGNFGDAGDNTEFTKDKKDDIGINLTNFFNLSSGEVNVKSLDPSEIDRYIDRMIFVMGCLAELFKNSSKYSFKVPLEDAFDTRPEFLSFVKSISLFFTALRYKFSMQKKGVNATSLSIDPTESGFPHFTDLWNFKTDIETAEEQLSGLPAAEEIAKAAVDSIFRGEFPVREQLLYARRNYFEFIRGENIISDFKIFAPQALGTKDGETLYKVVFYGFDERYNIFNHYSMLATQKAGAALPLHKTKDHAIFQAISAFYKQDLFKLALHLDTVDPDVHPKVLLKYTVGPYFSGATLNADNINAVLAEGSNDPFIFKFNISGVMSIQTLRESSVVKAFVNHLFGYANSREIFSEKFSFDHAIVPFKIKQFLRDRDEAGRPCRVFGVLDGGELVE